MELKTMEPKEVTRHEMRCPDCNTYLGDMLWGDTVMVCPHHGCHKVTRFTLDKGVKEDARTQ